jgi:hypothetical protein
MTHKAKVSVGSQERGLKPLPVLPPLTQVPRSAILPIYIIATKNLPSYIVGRYPSVASLVEYRLTELFGSAVKESYVMEGVLGNFVG